VGQRQEHGAPAGGRTGRHRDTPALGQETRRAALEGFIDLFEPGNIVDLANRFAGRFGPG
jgi:hypothetical protein